MLKHIVRVLPVAALIALAACQGNAPANQAAITDSLTVDSLSKQVMAVHDEAMAKMMVMRRLKTRTTELADSLTKIAGDAAPYTAAATQLDSANNAMNNWMHAYDMMLEGKTIAEKKAYLEAEKKKIDDVKALMTGSIDNAKKLLGEK